jgi:hypothetical protein
VDGHIWTGSESVNAFLQFYFNCAKKLGNPRLQAPELNFARPMRDMPSG